jgi:hypothetical protein
MQVHTRDDKVQRVQFESSEPDVVLGKPAIGAQDRPSNVVMDHDRDVMTLQILSTIWTQWERMAKAL